VFLAVAPHGEAGFISFGPSRDKDGNEKAEIYAIYVLPKFWNQGIGGELLDEAERSIRNSHFTAITLWVLEKNIYRTSRWLSNSVPNAMCMTPRSPWGD